MTSHKLTSEIISKIKEENISPIPKWRCNLYHGLFWLIFTLSAIMGAKALGISFVFLSNTDFDIASHSIRQAVPLWIGMIPATWLILFMSFSLLAYIGLRYTRKGYKLTIWKLIGLNLGISLILGATSYETGMAEKVEMEVFRRAPFMHEHNQMREFIWQKPDSGRLAGTIIEIQNGKIIIIQDFKKKPWTVDTAQSVLRHQLELVPQIKIKMIGIQTDEATFKAEMIAPWRTRKQPEETQKPNNDLKNIQE